jgi:hypothetical protein
MWNVKALDLARDWAVAHDGAECSCAYKDEDIIKGAGFLHQVANDDRRGYAGKVPNQVE